MKSVKSENNEYYRQQNLPYEKFIAYGSKSLTDSELLAILLRTGTRGVSAKDLGERVLTETARCGNGLLGLYHISLQDLMKLDGIGQVKAIQLKAIAELSTRMAQAKAKNMLSFHNPYSIADYYMERFRHENVEYIMLLMFDSALHLIKETILSKGTVNASLLSPREVFIHAFEAKAAGIMLLHNHPGGDPSPSENDITVTERIFQTGLLTDIPLLDHIIIGDNTYFSFKESKIMADMSCSEEAIQERKG
ncbi:MAG: DNA repair protein RadC [Lachnospiraceae bacterium]|nr:DNA repair protein RadC [Lachnospiraceae bacterium]